MIKLVFGVRLRVSRPTVHHKLVREVYMVFKFAIYGASNASKILFQVSSIAHGQSQKITSSETKIDFCASKSE